MRTKAGIIGAGLLGVALSAHAYTSPYSSMAVPGDHNTWNTTPSMVLAADNVWVCTQTLSSASGSFKFAANNGWTLNWGGGASLARVPAAARAPTPGGGNLGYAGFSNGLYRFTFNDSTLEFSVQWAGPSPLPLPAFSTLALIGDFNGWTASANSMLTNSPANTNLWSRSIVLEAATSFQFLPDGNVTNQWGAPEATPLAVPVVAASPSGKSDFSLSGFEPGTFLFELNTSNVTFSISQTETQAFTLSTMTVQGNFIATTNLPGNMVSPGGTFWESDHHITNSGTVTLRFVANGGVRIWGATNATPMALPASGSMATGLTAYANISGVSPGRYRITFDHQTGAYSFQRIYTEASGLNLLTNAGFEVTTEPGGGFAVGWGSWQSWPKRVADGYAPHSGNWCGAIHGQQFPEWTDYASFAQDVLVQSGQLYRASAWFKASPEWTASSMQVKIEWLDATNGALSGEAIENILALTTNWVKYSAEGTAPANATKAHVVFLCSGAGSTGTMHIDDAEMRAVAGRTQNFDSWGALASFGPFAPDWSITSGKTIYNVPPGRPAAAVLISQYVEGTGNNKAVEIYNGTLASIDLAAGNYVLQQYNNGSLTPSVSISLSGTLPSGTTLVVARPSVPTNFPPDLAISGLPGVWTNKNLTFNGDDVIVLRQGTNILDRVGQVGTNATGSIWSRNTQNRTLTRKSTIFTGTTSAVTAAFPLEDWILSANDTFSDLGSHDISYLDPNEPYTPAGYSLVMNSGATLMSGELPGGIGDLSFWYRTESMTPPVTMSIESGPSESGPWTVAETLSGIAASNFAYQVVGINRADHTYLRIRQTDGGTNRFRIDEVVVGVYSAIKRLEDFNAWTDPAYLIPGTYSRYGWSIESSSIATTNGVTATRTAFLAPPDGAVVSPAFEGGVGEVIFWAKASETDTPAYLRLQTRTNESAAWITQASFTVTTGRTFATWLYLPYNGAQARLVFNSAEDSGDVFIDNVEVRTPILYREQNFDGWPTRTSYISETQFGWTISNSIVDAQEAYAGQVARLNTTVGNYVLSPEIPDGLGTLSFRTRKWLAADTAPSVQVQLSPNGSSWITLGTVTPASTNYEQFTYYLNDSSNRFVRLFHSAGASRVLFDDIRIGVPQPRPEVLVTPTLDPATPLINVPMALAADVIGRYGATILSVTGYYRIASGPWNALPMAFDDNGYISTTFPAQAPGAMIRYYVQVRYAGIGAAPASTGYSTNTTTSATFTNYVATIRKGDVWINEIFYAPYGDEPLEYLDDPPYFQYVGCNHEFVEICGLAGSDVSGWRIELAFGDDRAISSNGGQSVYASYTLPPGTVFTNATTNQVRGYGFYVVGDSNLASNFPVNQALSTLVPTNVAPYSVVDKDHIYDGGVGVIRLVDQFGNVMYSLSYGGYAPGSDFINKNQAYSGETNSIGLSGSGFEYPGYDWEKAESTVGSPNAGQDFEDAPPDENAYAWHTQGVRIIPLNTNAVPPFYLFDPDGAGHFDTIDIYYGYTNAHYPNPDGTLYHRRQGSGSGWTSASMNIRVGSLDANGHAFVYGRILDHTYRRLQTIEYVLEVDPNVSGLATIYLGSDAGANNINTIYTNLAAAQASPFTYHIPIADLIVFTNITITTTNITLYTIGNDPLDYLTNFYVQYNTNLLTQFCYQYDSNTNIIGLASNTSWGTWANTNFTVSSNIYGDNVFRIAKPPSNWPKAFFRIVPRWP